MFLTIVAYVETCGAISPTPNLCAFCKEGEKVGGVAVYGNTYPLGCFDDLPRLAVGVFRSVGNAERAECFSVEILDFGVCAEVPD